MVTQNKVMVKRDNDSVNQVFTLWEALQIINNEQQMMEEDEVKGENMFIYISKSKEFDVKVKSSEKFILFKMKPHQVIEQPQARHTKEVKSYV